MTESPKAICKTCGCADGIHRPTPLDPNGIGAKGHTMTINAPLRTPDPALASPKESPKPTSNAQSPYKTPYKKVITTNNMSIEEHNKQTASLLRELLEHTTRYIEKDDIHEYAVPTSVIEEKIKEYEK